jgi:hypothetical protein
MFGCLQVGSRAPIYIPSSEALYFDDRTTSRTCKRDASPPPPRPPLPADIASEPEMPRVSEGVDREHLFYWTLVENLIFIEPPACRIFDFFFNFLCCDSVYFF